MPRYIDADALLESGICVEYGYNDNGLLLIPMRDVTNSIRNSPTIDAVPVVRCKDCKWHGRPGCAIEIVDDSDRPGPDGFCCYAERKQDGGADDV